MKTLIADKRLRVNGKSYNENDEFECETYDARLLVAMKQAHYKNEDDAKKNAPKPGLSTETAKAFVKKNK